MRRKSVTILAVLLGTAIGVFFFAPVVYSPVSSNFCGLETTICPITMVSVYKSPSCSVFGIGAAFVVDQGWYSIGCIPRIVFY